MVKVPVVGLSFLTKQPPENTLSMRGLSETRVFHIRRKEVSFQTDLDDEEVKLYLGLETGQDLGALNVAKN